MPDDDLSDETRYQVLVRSMGYLRDTLNTLAYRAEPHLATLVAPQPFKPGMAPQVVREARLTTEAPLWIAGAIATISAVAARPNS